MVSMCVGAESSESTNDKEDALVRHKRDQKAGQILTFAVYGGGNLPSGSNQGIVGSFFLLTVTTDATNCANCLSSMYVWRSWAWSRLYCTVTFEAAGRWRVDFIGAGTCYLGVVNDGNSNYFGSSAFYNFPIMSQAPPTPQTITFGTTAPVNPAFGSTYQVSASSTSGLVVTITASGCSISGSTVSHTTVGTCTISANQAGGNGFAAATQVQQSYTVVKANSTVSFTSSPPGDPAVGGTYSVSAICTAPTTVTFSSVNNGFGTNCSVSGNVVTFNAVGNCQILGSQAATTNFNSASAVQFFGIGLASQSINTFTPDPSSPVVGGSYNIAGTASSGLPVTFSVPSLTVCTLNGNTVSFIAVGTCQVIFLQQGNSQFNAATQVLRSFAIGRGTQTISFTSSMNGASVGGFANLLAVSSAGLPVTYSNVTGPCEVNGDVVSFFATGLCTVRASQAGSVNYNPASADQSVTIAIGTQTVNFLSTPPNPAFVADTFSVLATATSGLPVNVTVANSTVCSIGTGNVVSFSGVGVCTLLGNQAGEAGSYLPAPQRVLNITVSSLSLGSSTTMLFNCPTAFTCSRNLTGLTEALVQAENVFAGAGETGCNGNCSLIPSLPWLTPCNRDTVLCRLSVNGRRAANLNSLIVQLQGYLPQCATTFCTAAVNTSLTTNLDLIRSVAVLCVDPVCNQYKSRWTTEQRIWQGVPGAVAQELQRFDSEMVSESLFNLYVDTRDYYNCSTDACRSEYFQRVNVSFAVHGYIQIAKGKGLQVSNATGWKLFFDQVDSEYWPCALSACDGRNFSTIRNSKRSYYAAMLFLSKRLDGLLQNCSGACDSSGLMAARSSTQSSLYMAANYLPAPVDIAGIVIYSLIIVCCVVVFGAAIAWEAYHGKFLFLLVLLLIFLASVFRVAFFGAATTAGEVQRQYLTFVILDKLGLLFFCFALLVFCAMWSRAINIMAGDNSAIAAVILITATCFVAAIFAIVVYFAVVVSVTYISMYYYEFVTDYADIILSCVTLALAVALLIQIIFVTSKLKEDEEKLRNIRIIAIGVAIMVLALIERVVMVFVDNYILDYSLGYGVYYGVATILPELIVSGVMLAVILFSFSQTSGSGTALKTNPTYNASDSTEMSNKRGARYDEYT